VDTSVKTVEDIEKHIGAPIVGIIPQKVRPLVEEAPDSPHAEAYRVLRTNLQLSKKMGPGKTLCFTSGGAGEGKSLTLFNLAFVCAKLGDRVLIVDSDLRRPTQHKTLRVSSHPGLADVLLHQVPIESVIRETAVPNLYFLPSGKLSAASHGLLDSQRMKDLVAQLKGKYDFVFFDAPPIMGVSDASVISSEVEGVLLVVQHRHYPRVMSSRAKTMIENVGGNLVGVVLNNINVSRDYYYYYHSYYYSYYYRQRGEPGSGESAPPADRRTEAF
jgi:capsular exopolysaccharide synthesis family protein